MAAPQPGTRAAASWTPGRTPRPATTRPAGRRPCRPWRSRGGARPASTSRSVTPERRRAATTSRPWRRSATCMSSNRASSAGRSHAASDARSSGRTRAVEVPQELAGLTRPPGHRSAVDQVAQRAAEEQDDAEHDEDPVLGQERPHLPRLARGEHAVQERRAVERRDGQEVEDRERDVDTGRTGTGRSRAGRRAARRPRRSRTRKTRAPASAMRKFDAGPASATNTSPLRRSRRFAGLTGVGFAHPMRNPPMTTDTMVMRPPAGSKWTIGLSVRRPNSLAVASPCR